MVKKKNSKTLKDNFIYGNFIDGLKFIKTSKNYIFFALFLFILFAIIGYFITLPTLLYDQLMLLIKSLADQTNGLDIFGLIGFIFWNNLKSSFFALFFGIFLGIMPLIVIVFNGFLVGFVSRLSVDKSSEGIFSLWRLLPHGIFELFAVFISVGLGFKLGTVLFSKNPQKELKNRFILSVKTFFFVVLPLLFVAAIIEGILIFYF
jgi:stage II sporulation protein M